MKAWASTGIVPYIFKEYQTVAKRDEGLPQVQASTLKYLQKCKIDSSQIDSRKTWITIKQCILTFLSDLALDLTSQSDEKSIKTSLLLELPKHNIRLTLYDFTESLRHLALATLHAVWRRVPKTPGEFSVYFHIDLQKTTRQKKQRQKTG